MIRLAPRFLIGFVVAAFLGLALASAGMAETVISAPGDLVATGHGPEADALMNHYALESSTPFQFRLFRGVCSGDNECIGGADHGDSCNSTQDCASAPLHFHSGETEWFDANGNTIAGPVSFTDVDFEDGTALDGVGICNSDVTVSCSSPGGVDEDNCGTVDPACNARPSPGYVPHHANLLVRNPEEIVLHNLVPAAAEIRICFNEFNSMSGCDELIVRQSLMEYRVPPGPTYIYPLGVPSGAGEILTNGEAHEYFSHHRGVNNQRHAYDVLSTVGGDFTVGSVCDSGTCNGGARDGDTCTENGDCLDNANFFVYQEPVLAMTDGVVVALTQGYPENPNPPAKLPGVTSGNCRVVPCGSPSNCDGSEVPIVGNSVFIQHANGEVSMAAHLIPGSNDHLSCGDIVLQGDAVGLVGNSGNSTAPHLHYSTNVLPSFWSGANYSLPSYYTNAAFAFGPDPTLRRQLGVSLHSSTTLEVWAPVASLPANPPLVGGAVSEVEPNDTLSNHNALTLPTTVTGSVENQDVGDLAVRGDGIEDVFRFDLVSSDEIRIVFDGVDAGENLDVYALTEDLRVLNETGQGTSQGSFEELCLNLDAGAYYLVATNVDLTQDKDESYTLEVGSDPQTIGVAITNPQQPVEVDGSCQATISFEVDIHDNCCLDPDNLGLVVDAANPTSNLTLGDVVIDSVVASDSRNVTVTGHVDVSDVTSCPASVTIAAHAQDCSGNVVDTVSQGNGDSVDVVDVTPPVVMSSAGVSTLWPPNHTLVDVGFTATATDNCDAQVADALVTTAWSNEAEDANPHTPDAADLEGSLRLRAERSGAGSGRVYLLSSSAADACGNSAFACAVVGVPHSQSDESSTWLAGAMSQTKAYCESHGGAPPTGFFSIGQ